MNTTRPLVLFLAFSLFSANLHGEEPKKPSPAVKKILDEAVRDVKKNRQEFDKANQKPLGEARKELEDLSTKLIKEGKAEEAGVILKQIGSLDADVMKMANAPAPVGGGGGRVQPQKPLLERMAGKWTHPNHPTIFQIEANGQFREIWKSDGRVHHQGRLEVTADETAECVDTSGRLKLVQAGDDTLARLSWDPSGKPWNVGMALERIK